MSSFNPILKFYKIFIQTGLSLRWWNVLFFLFILLKILFYISLKRHNDLNFFKIIPHNIFLLNIYNSAFIFNPNFFFYRCLDNLKPVLVFMSKVISGTAQSIPTVALNFEEYSLCFRWLSLVLSTSEYYSNFIYFMERFFLEFLYIYLNKGFCFAKRVEFYSMALKNRNFLQFL